MKPKLKICGVTNVDDAQLVGESGADYCGILIEVGFSERSLSLEAARPVAQASGINNVILLCNPSLGFARQVAADFYPHAIQLQCQESPEFVAQLKLSVQCQVWKAIHLPIASDQPTIARYIGAGVDAFVADSIDTSEGFTRFGGTGKVGDWNAVTDLIQSVDLPVFLAGGINPENVVQAIREVQPYAIVLCSGVEAIKGKKAPMKIRALVENFRSV